MMASSAAVVWLRELAAGAELDALGTAALAECCAGILRRRQRRRRGCARGARGALRRWSSRDLGTATRSCGRPLGGTSCCSYGDKFLGAARW